MFLKKLKKNLLIYRPYFFGAANWNQTIFLGLNICDRKWCVSFAFCLELLLNLLWEINGLQHVPLCPALLFAVLWLMAAKKYIILLFFYFLMWLYSTGHHRLSGIIIHPRVCIIARDLRPHAIIHTQGWIIIPDSLLVDLWNKAIIID